MVTIKLVPKRKLVSGLEGIPEVIIQPIDSSQMLAASVISGIIKDGAISTDKIAANAITAAKIAAGTITATEITAGTITATEIAASTITTSELNFTPFVIGTSDLDDVGDGTSYKRVLSAHLDSGKLKLISTTTVDAGFTTDKVGEGASNLYDTGVPPSDLDDLNDGTTYERVRATQISAGKIELTSTSYKINEDGIIAGTPASTRCELTANGLRGYSDATLQFEIKASDGKGYFGAGTCYLDAAGVSVEGINKGIFIKDAQGAEKGKIYAGAIFDSTVGLAITATNIGIWGTIYYYASVLHPQSAGTTSLGAYTDYWGDVITDIVALKERTTPTATANFGKVYTKTDDKLYFQDGAGAEHELAFAV